MCVVHFHEQLSPTTLPFSRSLFNPLLTSLILCQIAEQFLFGVETQVNYPLLVLKLAELHTDPQIKVAAAILFKNFVKRNWKLARILPFLEISSADTYWQTN